MRNNQVKSNLSQSSHVCQTFSLIAEINSEYHFFLKLPPILINKMQNNYVVYGKAYLWLIK